MHERKKVMTRVISAHISARTNLTHVVSAGQVLDTPPITCELSSQTPTTFQQQGPGQHRTLTRLPRLHSKTQVTTKTLTTFSNKDPANIGHRQGFYDLLSRTSARSKKYFQDTSYSQELLPQTVFRNNQQRISYSAGP